MTTLLLNINKIILTNRIKEIQKQKGIVYIVDFDSGYITDLLIDIKRKHNINMVLDCFTTKNSTQHSIAPWHNVYKRELLTCSDSSYNYMFSRKKIFHERLVKSQQSYKKKMANVFFEIKGGDLRETYDMVFITGPNSNGRDIAFLHIQDRLKEGFIFMNELDKYLSLETMDKFYKTQISFKNNVPPDRMALYKIV